MMGASTQTQMSNRPELSVPFGAGLTLQNSLTFYNPAIQLQIATHSLVTLEKSTPSG